MGNQPNDVIYACLEKILKTKDFSITVGGNSERGSGFVSDVVFCTVHTQNNQDLDLVLKCSKSNEALLKATPAFSLAFQREICMYEEVLPYFLEFQKRKGVEKPFQSFPKCFGSFTKDLIQIVVLENLKAKQFSMWDGCEPLTRNHIDFVLTQYAQLHATSVALQEQEPEKFKNLLKHMDVDVMENFFEKTDFNSLVDNNVTEAGEILKDEISSAVLKKWLSFKKEIPTIFKRSLRSSDEFRVVIHGDCWINNFMFKYKNSSTVLEELAVLDWQLSTYSTPIDDLSYFLFSCSSAEDFSNIDGILENYYEKFSEHLVKLGSNFNLKYRLEHLKNDWKKYAKFGIANCLTTIKLPYCEGQSAPDMAASIEKGEDISTSFNIQICDNRYKKRLKAIVEYSATAELV